LSRIAAPLNFDLELGRGPRHSARPLAVALLDAIASGQLHDGDRLPSTRTLATSSRLPRSVVVAAYEELAAAGFLATRPGGGTYVEAGAAIASRAGAFGAALPRPTRPARVPARRISYDLRPGVADVQLIAERDWARAMRSRERQLPEVIVDSDLSRLRCRAQANGRPHRAAGTTENILQA